MFEFNNVDKFTLFDVFTSAGMQALLLKTTVPEEEFGRLEKYIDITRRIEEHVKPENFTLSGLNALLNEFDDGKSLSDPKNYPEPAPFVETQGEYEFAKILHKHMKHVIEHLDKLDIADYSFLQRPFMRWGMGLMGPKLLTVLEQRIQAYEAKELAPDAHETKATTHQAHQQIQSLTLNFDRQQDANRQSRRRHLRRLNKSSTCTSSAQRFSN